MPNKSKLRTQNKVCYLNDLTNQEKVRCNQICNLGFPKGSNHDFILTMNNPIVSILMVQQTHIIGVCFVNIETKNVMKPLSKEYLYLHTICIDPEFRGNGLCYHLVRNLLTSKIRIGSSIKHLGKDMNMYLHVCTNNDKPNIPAIKCYQKNGFKLVDMVHVEREEGTNTVMTRQKGLNKKSKRKKNSKKKRR